MRHLKEGRKFNRKSGPRRSFLSGLVSNLVMKGKIETTEARAKEMRPLVERFVTIGKEQNLAALRLLVSRIRSKKAAEKIYYEIAPRYKERVGGYTRIMKTSRVRKRDGVKVAFIEFI